MAIRLSYLSLLRSLCLHAPLPLRWGLGDVGSAQWTAWSRCLRSGRRPRA